MKEEYLRIKEYNKELIENTKCDDIELLYFTVIPMMNIRIIKQSLKKYGLELGKIKSPFEVNTKIYKDGIEIGYTFADVSPDITIDKEYSDIAEEISKDESVVEPIKGYHRVLDWHDVVGKKQVLAGGETVLHFMYKEITQDFINEIVNLNTSIKKKNLI